MRVSVVLFYLRHHRLPGLEVFLRSLPFQPRRMRRGLPMEQTNHLTLTFHRKKNSEMGRMQRWRTCSSLCASYPFMPASNSRAVRSPGSPSLTSCLAALTVGERNKSIGLNNSPFPSELWIWLVQLVSFKACQQCVHLWR